MRAIKTATPQINNNKPNSPPLTAAPQPPVELLPPTEEVLSDEVLTVYEGYLSEREQGRPTQYILGEWEFMGLPFHVGEGVLIPRGDTEVLVETILEKQQTETFKSILDIGLTLEYLETYGVPVLGYQTKDFPCFYCESSGFGVDYDVKDAEEVARIMKTKWDLGLEGGVLLGNPIPHEYSMDHKVIDKAILSAGNSSSLKINWVVEFNKPIKTGKGKIEYVLDYKLSRYACYLI